MTTNRSGSRVTIRTVDDVLEETAIGCGLHRWAVQGGSIQINTEQLRRGLEEVYDAADPDWMIWVDLDDLACDS